MTIRPHTNHSTIKRFIEGPGLVVAVEVPVIYAPEQPDEPLLEPRTLHFLDEVTQHAAAADIAWLERVGRVYFPRSA